MKIPIIEHEPVRKEVHSRCRFAILECEKWYPKIGLAQKQGGNLFSCYPSQKYSQARRIYIHYTNEFQRVTGLKLSK